MLELSDKAFKVTNFLNAQKNNVDKNKWKNKKYQQET